MKESLALEQTRERYELGAELARGGMAIVYRAHDRLAARDVAYKRLHLPTGASRARATALFEREYDVLARLRHPAVVRVHAYGIDAVGPYYTMELLEGADLYAGAPLELTQAAIVLRDVASALSLIHARRLVHRDVTPMNVRFDAAQRTKLIDFGALASFGTVTDVVGTPPFMAPECLRGEPLDARCDLFSLGALAYWTLSRKLAISARSMEQRLYDLEPAITPLSEHVPGLPADLEQLVHSLLSPNPQERPSNAAEVMRRLTACAVLPPERDKREVALSYFSHPPLLGREQELTVLGAALRHAREGESRVMLVQGASGMGRSALVDQLVVEAQRSGMPVLRAQGSAQDPPFATAQTLIRSGAAWHTGPTPLRSSAPPRQEPQEARRGTIASPTQLDLAARHAERVDTLQHDLTLLCHDDALVILIDDAERVDQDSLTVLAQLVQKTPRRLLLVLTLAATPQERGSALALLAASAQLVSLGPLSESDTLALTQSLFGQVPNVRRLGRWLFEQSGGMPGPCLRLVRALLEADVLQYDIGSFDVPHDVDLHAVSMTPEDELRGRLAQLSSEPLRVAQVLSLQDERLTLSQVAAATGLPGVSVLAAVEALRSRELVRVREEEVWLSDADIRRLVTATLDESARVILHRQIGRALLAQGHADEKLLLVAANLLRGGDHEQGSALLARALELNGLGTELGIDSAASMPLLEELLARRRAAGETDEQCVDLLAPLSSAGYFGDYSVQCLHGDRALAALLSLTGMRLAKRLERVLGRRLALLIGLLFATCRRLFKPALRRAGSAGELLKSLLAVASGSVASASAAFENEKAYAIVDSLTPFEALPERSAPRVAYEFARGTADVGGGRTREAAARYERLGKILEGPIRGLNQATIEIFRSASLYGRAQAEVTNGSARALELAEQLRHGHPFYLAPAEMTRMAYHALRGEQATASRCREQAELAALRNGMSWSSVSVMTARSVYAYALTRNSPGLVLSAGELLRLSASAPRLSLIREVALAYAALLEGSLETSIRGFEEVLRDERHAELPAAWLNRVFYAEAQRLVGRHEESKLTCLTILEDSRDRYLGDQRRHLLVQQLALAEAQLGDFAAAQIKLDGCLRELALGDNALLLGSLHRDRARVALWAGDRDSAARELVQMTSHFDRTDNPWLIRQCAQLRAELRAEGAAPISYPAHDDDADLQTMID